MQARCKELERENIHLLILQIESRSAVHAKTAHISMLEASGQKKENENKQLVAELQQRLNVSQREISRLNQQVCELEEKDRKINVI